MLSILKSKVVWLSVVLFVSIGVLPAAAQGPGHGRGFGMRPLFLEIDLSDKQKADILSVLETYENDILDSMDSIVAARQTFEARIKAEGIDESLVRQAYQEEMSLSLEDSAVVRVKLWSTIREKLTEDQIKQLEEKRAKIHAKIEPSQRAKHRLERIRSFLEPVSE